MTTARPSAPALALLLAVAVPAMAEDAAPDDAIKYRKGVMDAIGGAAGNIGAIVSGKVPQQDQLGRLTALLAAATDPAYTVPAFRQDTHDQGFEKTTATAKVWQDWDGFEKTLRKLGDLTSAAASAGGDVSLDQMKEIYDTCKSCHDDFREKN